MVSLAAMAAAAVRSLCGPARSIALEGRRAAEEAVVALRRAVDQRLDELQLTSGGDGGGGGGDDDGPVVDHPSVRRALAAAEASATALAACSKLLEAHAAAAVALAHCRALDRHLTGTVGSATTTPATAACVPGNGGSGGGSAAAAAALPAAAARAFARAEASFAAAAAAAAERRHPALAEAVARKASVAAVDAQRWLEAETLRRATAKALDALRRAASAEASRPASAGATLASASASAGDAASAAGGAASAAAVGAGAEGPVVSANVEAATRALAMASLALRRAEPPPPPSGGDSGDHDGSGGGGGSDEAWSALLDSWEGAVLAANDAVGSGQASLEAAAAHRARLAAEAETAARAELDAQRMAAEAAAKAEARVAALEAQRASLGRVLAVHAARAELATWRDARPLPQAELDAWATWVETGQPGHPFSSQRTPAPLLSWSASKAAAATRAGGAADDATARAARAALGPSGCHPLTRLEGSAESCGRWAGNGSEASGAASGVSAAWDRCAESLAPAARAKPASASAGVPGGNKRPAGSLVAAEAAAAAAERGGRKAAPFWCGVCAKDLQSAANLAQHVQSKAHARAAGAGGAAFAPHSSKESPKAAAAVQSFAIMLPSGGRVAQLGPSVGPVAAGPAVAGPAAAAAFWCAVCSKDLESPTNLAQHLRGKAHAKAAAAWGSGEGSGEGGEAAWAESGNAKRQKKGRGGKRRK